MSADKNQHKKAGYSGLARIIANSFIFWVYTKLPMSDCYEVTYMTGWYKVTHDGLVRSNLCRVDSTKLRPHFFVRNFHMNRVERKHALGSTDYKYETLILRYIESVACSTSKLQ